MRGFKRKGAESSRKEKIQGGGDSQVWENKNVIWQGTTTREDLCGQRRFIPKMKKDRRAVKKRTFSAKKRVVHEGEGQKRRLGKKEGNA